jgi:hypothetical protein
MSVKLQFLFIRKIVSISFNYKLLNKLAARLQQVDLRIFSDCKVYFRSHIDYNFSRGLKMLHFIHYIKIFAIDSLMFFYIIQFGLNLNVPLGFCILLCYTYVFYVHLKMATLVETCS